MIALLTWLRNIWVMLLASSRYAAIGGTAGAVLALLALWFDRNPYAAFFLGACLPLGPFYFWFSSARQMEKQLAAFQQWRTQKLISQSEYDELRAKALRWYTERLYGTQTSLSGRRPKGDERTEP